MPMVAANGSWRGGSSMPSVEVAAALAADPAATERCGEWFGARLARGDTVGLCGDLGTGKTTFVRGLARGLRLDDPAAVASPTYLLVVEHDGPVPLLHADAYLPGKLAAFLADGGLDYLGERRAVVVVEWADRIRNMLPDNTLWVSLEVAAEGGRQLLARVRDARHFPWLAALPKIWR